MFTEGGGRDFDVWPLYFLLPTHHSCRVLTGRPTCSPLGGKWRSHGEQEFQEAFTETWNSISCKWAGAYLFIVHFSSLYSNESIHSEASLNIVFLTVNHFFFLGDLLENPSKDQRVAAPECSCSSDSSSRRSWWGWEAKRPPDRRIPGRGRGGRGGGGCRWTQSPGPACSTAGTKKEEPHLRSHRWGEVSHIFCGFSNDSS